MTERQYQYESEEVLLSDETVKELHNIFMSFLDEMDKGDIKEQGEYEWDEQKFLDLVGKVVNSTRLPIIFNTYLLDIIYPEMRNFCQELRGMRENLRDIAQSNGMENPKRTDQILIGKTNEFLEKIRPSIKALHFVSDSANICPVLRAIASILEPSHSFDGVSAESRAQSQLTHLLVQDELYKPMLSEGRKTWGEPARILERALRVNTNNQTSLRNNLASILLGAWGGPKQDIEARLEIAELPTPELARLLQAAQLLPLNPPSQGLKETPDRPDIHAKLLAASEIESPPEVTEPDIED